MIENENKLVIIPGYKVFGGERSLTPATKEALQRIRYKPGRWNAQKETDYGPFAVFEEYDQALMFMKQGYGTQIRKVDYIPSEDEALWKKGPPEFRRSKYGRGYYPESTGIIEKPISSCPKGTRLAKEIFVYNKII